MQNDKEEEETKSLPSIVVHGGVHKPSCSIIVEKTVACQKAACAGYDKLRNGASAVEAVEAALRWLEDDELFNCGYGSAMSRRGEVLTHSTIVNGKTQECGSVVAISRVDHPVSVARHVMKICPNAILHGEKAFNLAGDIEGVVTMSKGNEVAPAAYATFVSLDTSDLGMLQLNDDIERRLTADLVDMLIDADATVEESVGCVAWDGLGMAAGSTTGGNAGRALLGTSVWADWEIGCSVTGPVVPGLARRCTSDVLSERHGIVRLRSEDGLANVCFSPDNLMPFAFMNKENLIAGYELDKAPNWG